MTATELLPIIAIVSIVTVEWGGWALLSALTGKEEMSAFRHRLVRAGHAHAGVLLVLSLVYYLYLPRADFSSGLEWAAGVALLLGIQAQAGGFFVHMARGENGVSQLGPRITRTGAFLIGAALITLAIGLTASL